MTSGIMIGTSQGWFATSPLENIQFELYIDFQEKSFLESIWKKLTIMDFEFSLLIRCNEQLFLVPKHFEKSRQKHFL